MSRFRCLLAFLACRVCVMGGVGDRPRLLVPDVSGIPLLSAPVLFLLACFICLIFCACLMEGRGERLCVCVCVCVCGGGGVVFVFCLFVCAVACMLLAPVVVVPGQGLASSAQHHGRLVQTDGAGHI